MKKRKTFDSSYVIGKSYFEEDRTQIYLVFEPIYKYFKRVAGIGNGSYIYQWQSIGLSDGKINSIKTSNYNITPNLNYCGTKKRVGFNRTCLKQDSVRFNHTEVVNIYIVCEISKSINISDYPIPENCLFGAVTLTKNTDIDKQKYFGCKIRFDRHGSFLSPGIGLGRNVITFGEHMTSSTKIDNRKKDILILGKGPTQGLEHTPSAEKMFSINFTEHNKKFCLSLHYKGANNYLFVNGKEIHKLKVKDTEIVATPLCLGNISKNWTVDNMKKTGLIGYVYDFSVDYDAIAFDDVLKIYSYLMKKNGIV